MIAIFCLCLASIAIRVEMFEVIWNFTRAHDEWQLDEALTVLMFLAPVLGLFALRRWRQLQAEVRLRVLAEQGLIHARNAAESASRAKSDRE